MMRPTAVSIIPWWALAGVAVAVVLTVVYARLLMRAATTSEAVRRLEASASSLGRALVPLLLPVLVLLVLLTAHHGWRAQVTAGVLLAAILWFLLHGESEFWLQLEQIPRELGEAMTNGNGQRGPSKNTLRGSVPLGLFMIGFVVVELLGQGWSAWKEAAGTPGALVWLGIQLLVLAAVLRLVGYATSLVRWLVVAGVVVIALRLGMVIGLEVLPSENHLGARLLELGPSLAILVIVVGGLVAGEAILLGGQPASEPSLARKLVRIAGLGLALFSAATIAAGTVWAGYETTDGAEAVAGAEPVAGATAEEQQPVALAGVPGGRNEQLAWTFAPVLRLHDDEQYPPTSARDYFKRAAGDDPRQLRCTDCADPANSTNEGLHPEGVMLYARIATPETDPVMFEAWTPGPEPVATLIQYWIFYDYNRWSAQTVLGRMVQEHDADWEFVAVGLDADDRPLFLALSAHCGGQVTRWNDKLAVVPDREIELPIGGSGSGRGSSDKRSTHPIVAVALGSHGNYANDGGRRPPDWGSCKKLPTDALGPLTYASNVRDLTAGDTETRELVEADDIELVTDTSYPFGIPARWGLETLSFGKRTFGPTKGPRSPPRQATWNQALERFFCDRDWRPFERAPRDRC